MCKRLDALCARRLSLAYARARAFNKNVCALVNLRDFCARALASIITWHLLELSSVPWKRTKVYLKTRAAKLINCLRWHAQKSTSSVPLIKKRA